LSSYAKAPFTGPPVGVSYKMMGGTCSPGNCAWEARFPSKTRSVEVAFPLAKFGAWAQDVRGLLSKARGCFPLFGMYLRFSSGSNIPLDMAEGGPTVLFEIHVLQNVDPTKFENSNAVYDELQQMTIRKYGGRLHWGKNEAAAFEGVGPRAYPQWQTFEALRRDLDPQGVFENSFLRVVRGEESVEGSEGCVAKRQCICKTDVDCGPGYACSPGFQFEEARVCRKAKGSFCARGYDCSSGTCSGFRCQ
jgi:hypothetical protein